VEEEDSGYGDSLMPELLLSTRVRLPSIPSGKRIISHGAVTVLSPCDTPTGTASPYTPAPTGTVSPWLS
jgi:hypothetical protein